jgi:hypothetical protein
MPTKPVSWTGCAGQAGKGFSGEAVIEDGFMGVLGAFEIYRGSARGHRMANLRIIVR